MVDAAGTTTYSYTTAGRLFTEDGPWASDTVTNWYRNGLRTNLSLGQPTGVWTNELGYDAAKRLTSVTSPAGIFTYTLGGAGAGSPLIKKISLPNTSYITNTFDTVARLLGTWLKNNTNGTLDSASYAYNTGNQRTTFTNAAGTFLGYTYDPIGQLKVADSSVNSEDRGYTYDTAWNLNYLTNNGALKTFKVDPLNQLTNVTGMAGAQTYDGNGNVSYGDNVTYTWDDENRLVRRAWSTSSLHHPADGAQQTDFVYDGQGRLRVRTEYVFSQAQDDWVWESQTAYLYDGMRVIQERDENNTPLVSYTRGTDLSGSLEGAGGIGGLLARSHGYSGGNWSTHNYYHADGNGNITYLVDSSQALAASYRFDPFGNTLSSSGSLADANVYRFSSKEIHVKSGLYYYTHRWYPPSFQRWPNRDPIGEHGGLNLYRFVNNSPVNFIDTDGRQIMPSMPYYPPSVPPNSPPGFIGGEAHFFIGSGFTRVSCCDENKTKRIFWYRKICIGGAIGFGAGGGVVVSGLSGTKCRGTNYEGWFYELGGSIGLWGGGADVGYSPFPGTENWPIPIPGDVSGVNEIGGGLGKTPRGVMFKSTWCYYTLFSEKQIPCGCGK